MAITIETKRCILKPLSMVHLADIEKLNTDPEVMKFFPGGAQTKDDVKTRVRTLMGYYE